jgi:hypothetical protein
MSDRPYKFRHGKLRLTDGSNQIVFFEHSGGGNITDLGRKLFAAGSSTNAIGTVTLTSTNQRNFSRYDTEGINPTRGNIGKKRRTRKIESITQTFSSQTEVAPSFAEVGFSLKNDGDSGTWTPTDLGTSVCVGWWSADSLSALSNGDSVSSWTSSEGNSISATQGTSANQPTYVASSTISGKPAVNFDGASSFDHLFFTESDMNVGSGSLVCCFIGNANDGSSLAFGTITRGANSAKSIQLLYTNNNNFIQPSVGTVSDQISSSNFPSGTTGTDYRSIVFGRHSGNLMMRYIGDELSDEADASSITLTATQYAIGSAYFSGGCEGEIAEIMYLANPTLTQIKQVEGYAAHKYSLTGSLPANHPYKYSPPTRGNDLFVGGDSVSSSNGYKLSPGEEIPFLNCQINSINMVQSSGTCTASTISI